MRSLLAGTLTLVLAAPPCASIATAANTPSIAYGMAIIVAWAAVLYVLAVGIFRRRELATYSGQ